MVSEGSVATDNWGEVIGQADAVDQLRASVASPVHAYLFLGPHGSGRWAAARAFAADVLSVGLDGDAADRASRLALRGEHPDLVRVDPAGNQYREEEVGQILEIFEKSGMEIGII